jgi:hypothetical protein
MEEHKLYILEKKGLFKIFRNNEAKVRKQFMISYKKKKG